MKMRRCSFTLGALALVAVLGWMAPATSALAQPAQLAEPAGNRIEKMVAAEQGGSIVLKLTMAQPLSAAPGSFSVANPARIAFDFPDTANGLGRNARFSTPVTCAA
jgi:type IV pilus assembly protein PilQ